MNGTSKLVREDDVIKISRRKGKKESYNCVYISDQTRDAFFHSVRYATKGDVVFWGFSKLLYPDEYTYWDSVMKKLYMERKDELLRANN